MKADNLSMLIKKPGSLKKFEHGRMFTTLSQDALSLSPAASDVRPVWVSRNYLRNPRSISLAVTKRRHSFN